MMELSDVLDAGLREQNPFTLNNHLWGVLQTQPKCMGQAADDDDTVASWLCVWPQTFADFLDKVVVSSDTSCPPPDSCGRDSSVPELSKELVEQMLGARPFLKSDAHQDMILYLGREDSIVADKIQFRILFLLLQHVLSAEQEWYSAKGKVCRGDLFANGLWGTQRRLEDEEREGSLCDVGGTKNPSQIEKSGAPAPALSAAEQESGRTESPQSIQPEQGGEREGDSTLDERFTLLRSHASKTFDKIPGSPWARVLRKYLAHPEFNPAAQLLWVVPGCDCNMLNVACRTKNPDVARLVYELCDWPAEYLNSVCSNNSIPFVHDAFARLSHCDRGRDLCRELLNHELVTAETVNTVCPRGFNLLTRLFECCTDPGFILEVLEHPKVDRKLQLNAVLCGPSLLNVRGVLAVPRTNDLSALGLALKKWRRGFTDSLCAEIVTRYCGPNTARELSLCDTVLSAKHGWALLSTDVLGPADSPACSDLLLQHLSLPPLQKHALIYEAINCGAPELALAIFETAVASGLGADVALGNGGDEIEANMDGDADVGRPDHGEDVIDTVEQSGASAEHVAFTQWLRSEKMLVWIAEYALEEQAREGEGASETGKWRQLMRMWMLHARKIGVDVQGVFARHWNEEEQEEQGGLDMPKEEFCRRVGVAPDVTENRVMEIVREEYCWRSGMVAADEEDDKMQMLKHEYCKLAREAGAAEVINTDSEELGAMNEAHTTQ